MLCPTVPATWLCCPPQVEPPVTAAQGGQGASLLWWAQDVKPTDTLWTVAKEGDYQCEEREWCQGRPWHSGLACMLTRPCSRPWAREIPSFNPPFTASLSSAQGLAVLKSQRFACPMFNRQSL